MRMLGSIVVIMSLSSACSRSQGPSEAQPNVGSAEVKSAGTASAPNGAKAAPAERPRSARLDDPRWVHAMGEDPAGKQALADAVGAAGLVEALEDGGEITKTALEALPLADDADAALGPLARRARAADSGDLASTLEAILAIAGRPATARETLDPEGAAEAGAVAISIATNESLPRETRALAISAARAFAEKRIVDPAKIPAVLDPP
jgi:hypothetical protein